MTVGWQSHPTIIFLYCRDSNPDLLRISELHSVVVVGRDCHPAIIKVRLVNRPQNGRTVN